MLCYSYRFNGSKPSNIYCEFLGLVSYIGCLVLFKWRRQSLVSEPGQNFVPDWTLRILRWKFNLFKWRRQSLVSEPGQNCVLDWTLRILRWRATYNSTLSIGAFPFHLYQPRFFVDSGTYIKLRPPQDFFNYRERQN